MSRTDRAIGPTVSLVCDIGTVPSEAYPRCWAENLRYRKVRLEFDRSACIRSRPGRKNFGRNRSRRATTKSAGNARFIDEIPNRTDMCVVRCYAKYKLVKVGFCADDSTCVPQCLDGICIPCGSVPCKRFGCSTGRQVGGVDVVLDDQGHTGKRPG